MTLRARLLAVLAVSVAFGVAVAVLKGGEAGVRDSLGNLSAPWLLLPYFAGLTTRGWWRGALVGLAACMAALLGFYVAEAFVLDLGGHPLLTNLALTVPSGRMYFAAGLVSGPLFGALGAVPGRIRPIVTAAVVGVTLTGEPLAVFAWLASASMSPADTGMVVAYPVLWIGEMLLGAVLFVGMLALRGGRSQRLSRTPNIS
jgi:hypothetical protein